MSLIISYFPGVIYTQVPLHYGGRVLGVFHDSEVWVNIPQYESIILP